jgi:tRNA 2-thiouridine synthesizing protein A
MYCLRSRAGSGTSVAGASSHQAARSRPRVVRATWYRCGRRAADTNNRNRGDINVQFDKELDARGLSCPLPILKTKKALNDLTSGQVLKVVATDPGSVKDMQAFASQTGNPLLSSAEENKDFVFYLKKK